MDMNIINKHKDDDYYHVNATKITFYIYNYTTGFVEPLKDQQYKISQVVKQINAEKEKLSKMNAKYLANPKLAKEKKRGNINKKNVNNVDEFNSYNEQTIKLKEIQKALNSKEKQTSIVNLCIFSFIILILIIGSSVMSILINYYLKDKTYLFYSLIKNSIDLFKNILMEISFVRELIIIDTPFYKNYYNLNKTQYFNNFSKECYEYYLDSSFIISNLTKNINLLDEKQKKFLLDNTIDCYIIELNETKPNITERYRPKKYIIPIFNAYRELNAALYHISQMKSEEIYTYNEDIYFFIKNGMSNLIIYAEKQIETLTNEFGTIVKKGNIIIIICIIALFLVYVVCFLIFNHFYEKVEERKRSYLSVFYEIGEQFIISSLAKCEKFSQKLQLQEDNIGTQADKFSADSSSIDDSYLDIDIQASSIIKQNKENKINSNKNDKNGKNIALLRTKIFGFIIFFILLLCQYASYIYYYFRLSLYKNCIQYEHYLTNYMSSFLFPFIGIREYIYDKQKTFYNTPVGDYITNALEKFYTNLAEASKNKDKYIKYFPNSYTEYLNYLYSDKINELINEFIKEYGENGLFTNHENFFYDSSDYGFFTILTMYIEEIRMLRDTVDIYLANSSQKNYKYNESFYKDPHEFYEEYYLPYNNVNDYKSLNPANSLNSQSHKTIFIVYRFIISRVMLLALDKMFWTFEGIFETTTKTSLIINIIFILVVIIGFSLVWLPFVLDENETIYKTKNMLSIIPNEILITLPHINIMLGIDAEND